MANGTEFKPESDVYTMLLMIATLFVLVATVFLCIRSNELFGSWLPPMTGG